MNKQDSTIDINSTLNFNKEEIFWLDKLKGELPDTTISYDFLDRRESKMVLKSFTLENDINSKLVKISNNSDSRLYVVLLSSVFILLKKYLDEDDIIVGAPILKQDNTRKFINNQLIFRQRVDNDLIVKQLIINTREHIIAALDHQNFPIETLSYRLDSKENQRNTLYKVAVLLESIHDKSYLKNKELDIIFQFNHADNDKIECNIEYNSLLYKDSTIDILFLNFSNLLSNILGNLDQSIGEVKIASDNDINLITNQFNPEILAKPDNSTLNDFITSAEAKYKDSAAIVYKDQIITFGELKIRSDKVCNELLQNKVDNNSIIGIMMERSIELIIGLIGIVKSGAAYFPIDPSLPENRKNYMIKDSGCKLILSDSKLLERVNNSFMKEVNIILFDNIDFSKKISCKFDNVITPDHLLYLIYTSGSTGRPKGVLVDNAAFVNTLGRHKEYFNQTSADNMSQAANISFDAFGFEIWPCITAGATLYIEPDEIIYSIELLRDWLIRNQITITYQPTVIGEKLLTLEWPVNNFSLKYLRVAGEKLTRLPEKALPFRFFNLYGPTEDSVWSTSIEIDNKVENQLSNIGKPLFNKGVLILNKEKQINPVGIIGEIYIKGQGLARGYLNNPELTNNVFLNIHDSRFYKTGDKGRWKTDGNIEFIGRDDSQVKIHGYRIELSEVQYVIENQFKAIKKCFVTIKEINNEKFICVYYEAKNEISSNELRNTLSSYLPAYMIPSMYVWIESFPLTPNGKIDVHALPAPSYINNTSEQHKKSRTEEILSQIWSEILGIPKNEINSSSNFFALGGHSLKITLLSSFIKNEFNIVIPLEILFENQTLAEVAQKIDNLYDDNSPKIEVLKKQDSYAVSLSQEKLWYSIQVSDPLLYNIQDIFSLSLEFNKEQFEKSIRYLIKRHESFRTSFFESNGEVRQIIHNPEHVSLPVQYHDLMHEENKEAKIEKIIKTEIARPFNLQEVPLFRITVMLINENDQLILLNTNHIITDASSLKIMQDEFFKIYNALTEGKEEFGLNPINIQYKDYAQWQRNAINNGDFEVSKKFWQETFKVQPPALDLPYENNENKSISTEGNAHVITLDTDVYKSLLDLSVNNNTSLFNCLLSSVSLLLHHYSNNNDFVLCVPTDGRNHPELVNQIGYFVNILPMRINFNFKDTFIDLFQKVRKFSNEAMKHKHYPFDLIVKNIGESKSTADSWLKVITQLLYKENEESIQAGESLADKIKSSNNQSKFSLNIGFIVDNDKIEVRFLYKNEVFNKEIINQMAEHYLKIIDKIRNGNFRISDLDLEEEIILPELI